MPAAVNSVWLLLSMLSLGYLGYRPRFGGRPPGTAVPDFQTLGSCWIAAMLAAFLTGLAAPSWRALLAWGWLPALAGAGCLLWDLGPGARLASPRPTSNRIRFDAPGLAFLILTLGLLTACIMTEPLLDWDARSIWFFHAKIIHHADRLLTDVWRDATMPWAHLDYPKLNAFLAALSSGSGPWNESRASISLVLLWAPVVLLAVGWSKLPTRRLLLLAVLLLKGGELVWNGTMDAVLAAYAALAAMYGGRFAVRRRSDDLIVALLGAGVCACLKNEGLVLAGLIIGWTLFAAYIVRHVDAPMRPGADLDMSTGTAPRWRLPVAAGVALAPSLVWWTWKHLGGVTSDLAVDGATSRLGARLADPEAVTTILAALLRPKEVRGLAPFLLILVALVVSRRLRLKTAWWRLLPPVGVAGGHLAVLFVVYLATPADLGWHLATSARRTVQAVFVCLAAGVVGLLGEDERATDRWHDPAQRFDHHRHL